MKKRVAALILGLFFILNALPCAALDINPATVRDFDVPSQAAILIDEDSGTVLYEKNADESRAAELEARHDAIMADFDKLDATIKREEKVAEAERRAEGEEQAAQEGRARRRWVGRGLASGVR